MIRPMPLYYTCGTNPAAMADNAPLEWRALIEHVNTSRRYTIGDMNLVFALLAPDWEDMGFDGSPPETQ